MGTLWPILSVLSLFFLQLVSLGQGVTVTINPEKDIFYSEMGGTPKENITCQSDCHVSCKYTWYMLDDNELEHFTDGKILFRDKTIAENTTFQCHVQQPMNIENWSPRVKIIVNAKKSQAPTHDTDVGIDFSSSNSETTTCTSTIKKEYGPRNVSIYSLSDLEDLWEGRGNFTLTCRANCNPRCARYQIYHDEQVISNTKVKSIEKDRKNSGKYRCAAYDVKSEDFINSSYVAINIKYGPYNVILELSSDTDDLWEGSGTFMLTCKADCNPRCDNYIFYHNGQVLSIRNNTNMAYITKDRNNSGKYSCGAYNVTSGGYVRSDKVDIGIKYRTVSLSSNKKEMSLRVNHSLPSNVVCTIDCNFQCGSEITVTKNSRPYRKIKSNQSIFNQKKAIPSNSGFYRCSSGTSHSVDDFKLNILYGPRNIKITNSEGKVQSEIVRTENYFVNYRLRCSFECSRLCSISWYKDNRILDKEKWQDLIITMNRYKSGTYKCEAGGIEGKLSSDPVKITVQYPPGTVVIKPSNSVFYTKRYGTPLSNITCDADCLPQCSYEWYGRKRRRPYDEILFTRGSVLYAHENFTKNFSRFRCAANNSVGKKYSSRSIVVKVKVDPTNVTIKYTNTGQNLEEYSSGSVYVICQAECNPACSYKFYHKGQQIRNWRRENRLWIWKRKENTGRYSCSAKNVFNGPKYSSNFVDIFIQYKPKLKRFEIIPVDIIVPGFINLNFEVDSFPPSNVTIVFNEKILRFYANVTGMKSDKIEIKSCLDEGEVKIMAKNNIGSDDDFKRITVKCSPMILTYSNVSNKGYNIGDPLNVTTTFIAYPAADVSWSFLSYKSRNVSQKVEGSLIHSKEKMTSIIIVDKLHVDNFGIYQLTLVNDIGNETLSFSIKGPPLSPTDLTLDCLSAAFLEWKPGFDGGTDQSFLIEYTTNISSPWFPQSGLSITSKDNDRMSTYVTLMNPNVRYFFRVISENVFGRVISDKIVNCTLQAVGEEESFLSLDTIAGISGGLVLILVALIVLVLFGVKKYQNHHRKGQKARKQNTAQEEDCGVGMIENTLYISGDDVNNSTILSSKYPQNDALNTESRNDVYSVVKKTEKIEPDFPMYAEVCKSRPAKNKPAIKKKPAKKTENSTGKTVNTDGLVYVEIDLKNTPALSGNSVIHGSDNKTLYVDIDFTQHADPLPECDVEDADDANLNKKKQQE